MADFDAELHLRLAGEQMILDGDRDEGGSGWSSPIVDVAAALVAVDAISLEQAQSIARDYEIALSLRGHRRSRGGMFREAARHGRDVGQPLPPARLATCQGSVTTSWGTVWPSFVRLSEEATVLAGTVTGIQRSLHQGPAAADLADDQGNHVAAHFSGGGGGDTFTGRLEGRPGLSTTTRWIEIDGARVELTDQGAPLPATVEALPPASPAERHLWSIVSGAVAEGPRRTDVRSLPAIVDVLVAAGAIDPEDPSLRAIRAVAEAGETGDASSPDLPPRWASLLSRRLHRFHRGDDGDESTTLLIGAEPVVLDGVHLRVDAATVRGRDVEIDLEISPPSALGSWTNGIGTSAIEWWAEDDRGNHYLGSVRGGGGSDARARGTVGFTPSVADGVETFRLLPTARTERAVIEVPFTGVGVPR